MSKSNESVKFAKRVYGITALMAAGGFRSLGNVVRASLPTAQKAHDTLLPKENDNLE